jgi:hypothetical protein
MDPKDTTSDCYTTWGIWCTSPRGKGSWLVGFDGAIETYDVWARAVNALPTPAAVRTPGWTYDVRQMPGGWVHFDGWAGHAKFKVSVLGETRARYRVRYEEDMLYGRRVHRRGDVVLVPKRAVTKDKENEG